LLNRHATMTGNITWLRDFGGLLRGVATSRVHSAVLALGVAAAGCATDAPQLSDTQSASTVGDYAHSGCSTAVVIGLSRQIAEQANCEHPGNFVRFTKGDGITITSNAVLPYLASGARGDLETVAKAHALDINSALRTVAQQYLLYEWYLQGRCGITAAATPGTSNHEGGRAVDLEDWSTRIADMHAHGWSHDVPGDPVHFDHLATPDRRGEDVHAFQVLWNRNHPNDEIATDGAYGPQTQARLVKSPATGFAKGPSCPAQAADVVVAVDGADLLPPTTQQHFAVTLSNTGTTDWPAGAQIELADATSSALHDPSWTSQTVIGTLVADIPAGGQGTVDFDVTTPAMADPTPIVQSLQIDDNGTIDATFDLAITIVPGMTEPQSSDGNDEPDADLSGGCTTGGGGTLAPLALAALIAVRRRRAG